MLQVGRIHTCGWIEREGCAYIFPLVCTNCNISFFRSVHILSLRITAEWITMFPGDWSGREEVFLIPKRSIWFIFVWCQANNSIRSNMQSENLFSAVRMQCGLARVVVNVPRYITSHVPFYSLETICDLLYARRKKMVHSFWLIAVLFLRRMINLSNMVALKRFDTFKNS